jgi:hypothetical protein
MSDDQTRDGGGKHQGPDHSSPYPVSRLDPPHDLVDVAREIEKADGMLKTAVGSKLEVIAEQIRALQDKARDVLEQAERDSDLHRARCNFHRRPGNIYHLYRKQDGSLYFSMLSPEEWGGEPPHEFVGSYRLEADMSWTPAEQLDTREDPHQLAERLLSDRNEER